eukprot:Nk52_evm8s106 gene=Nk52_evmTU8s106
MTYIGLLPIALYVATWIFIGQNGGKHPRSGNGALTVRKACLLMGLTAAFINIKCLLDWFFCAGNASNASTLTSYVGNVGTWRFSLLPETLRNSIKSFTGQAHASMEHMLCVTLGGRTGVIVDFSATSHGLLSPAALAMLMSITRPWGLFLEITALWVGVWYSVVRLMPLPVRWIPRKKGWKRMMLLILIIIILTNTLILFGNDILRSRLLSRFKKLPAPLSMNARTPVIVKENYRIPSKGGGDLDSFGPEILARVYRLSEPERFTEFLYGAKMKEKLKLQFEAISCKAENSLDTATVFSKSRYLKGSVYLDTIFRPRAEVSQPQSPFCFDVERKDPGHSQNEVEVVLSQGKAPYTIGYLVRNFDGQEGGQRYIEQQLQGNRFFIPIKLPGVYELTSILDDLGQTGTIVGEPIRYYECPELHKVVVTKNHVCLGDSLTDSVADVSAHLPATVKYTIQSREGFSYTGTYIFPEQENVHQPPSVQDDVYHSINVNLSWPVIKHEGQYLIQVTSLQDRIGNVASLEMKLSREATASLMVHVHRKPMLNIQCGTTLVSQGALFKLRLQGTPPFGFQIEFKPVNGSAAQTIEVENWEEYEYSFKSEHNAFTSGVYSVREISDLHCINRNLRTSHQCFIDPPLETPKPSLHIISSTKQCCLDSRIQVAKVRFTGSRPWILKYSFSKTSLSGGSDPTGFVEETLTSKTPIAPIHWNGSEHGIYEYRMLSLQDATGTIVTLLNPGHESGENSSPYIFEVDVKARPSVELLEKNENELRCRDEPVNIPIHLTGMAPFALKVKETTSTRSQTVQLHNIDDPWVDLWGIHPWTDSTFLQLMVVEVSDATGCTSREDISPITIMAPSVPASASWERCGDRNGFIAIKEGLAELPKAVVNLQGTKPFKLVYLKRSGVESKTVVVENIDDYLYTIPFISKSDEFELLEVFDTDRHCKGSISSTYTCRLHILKKPRAEIMKIDSTHCASKRTNILNIAHVSSFGQPPFSIPYKRVHRPFQRFAKGLDQKNTNETVSSSVIHTWSEEHLFTDMIDAKATGTYEYIFEKINDKVYSAEDSLSPAGDLTGSKVVSIQLHPLPQVSLNYGTEFVCDDQKNVINFMLLAEGNSPFKTYLEITETIKPIISVSNLTSPGIIENTPQRNIFITFLNAVDGSQEIDLFKILQATTTTSSGTLQAKFSPVSRSGKEREYSVRILNVTDANGCTFAPEPSKSEEKVINIGPPPQVNIIRGERGKAYSCVTDLAEIQVSGGEPPFALTYQLGQEDPVTVETDELSVFALMPTAGILRVNSIKNIYCENYDVPIEHPVYEIPTAAMENGKEDVKKIHREKEEVPIKVKFTGIPPWSFGYRLVPKEGKALFSSNVHDVLGIASDTHYLKESRDGRYDLVYIKDKFCSYPKQE